MSFLSKIGGILLISMAGWGLTTQDTPLFNPHLSATNLGLGQSATASQEGIEFMLQNPASITDQQSIAFQASRYLGIDYNAMAFTFPIYGINLGIHYLGAYLPNIQRSIRSDNDVIVNLDDTVPYEFHHVSVCLAKRFWGVYVGVGANYQILRLDDRQLNELKQFAGIQVSLLPGLTAGASIQNFSNTPSSGNALQSPDPITALGVSVDISPQTRMNIAIIHNKNTIATHPTLHYGISHYITDYLPIRLGLDHNRFSAGLGFSMEPLHINVGWAQSIDAITENQWMMGIVYDISTTPLSKKFIQQP